MDTKEAMLEFGKRMSRARSRKGMTQRDLAKFLGVSQTTVTFWENGRNKELPSDEVMAKLAVLLGTKVESLLGANEFILDRYDPAVAEWLMSEESIDFVNKAFVQWMHETTRRS